MNKSYIMCDAAINTILIGFVTSINMIFDRLHNLY